MNISFDHHLMIMPIVLPLFIGALLLFFDERRRKLKSALGLFSVVLQIIIALILLAQAVYIAPASDVYLLGNWKAPFGIVLVLDRLSALMLMLSPLLGLAALIFAQAHWAKAGPHFQSFVQFILMGVNGAFLTGDLFNLFVFFEVMLTASYALMLHSSGAPRVRAGLHYVVVNLIASSFFLLGAALIYGITGTLNMADLAQKIATIPAENQVIFKVGMAMLGLAFLIKAGMWPLGFWLVPAYSTAVAPVGAIFSILSKVGIYAILRLSLLAFSVPGSVLIGFGNQLLFYGGLATLIFGMIGVLASQALGRLAAYSVLVSSGTLLAVIGTGNNALTSGALFYLISSTLALSAFFLLVELIERSQDTAANVLAVTMEVYGEDEEEEEDEIGTYLPATLAILGVCFAITAILIIGMPPFSGFIAKVMIITGIFNPDGFNADGSIPSMSDWVLVTLIVLSGLCALIAMTRVGIRTFWAPIEGQVPKVQIIEFAPIAGLLALCFMLTVFASPVFDYLDALSRELHHSAHYIDSVLSKQPVQVKGEAL